MAALLAGAFVQGVVGLGIGLFAAPVVSLLEPQLMPGYLLLLVILMPVVTLRHERGGVHWHGLAWSLPLRVPGTVVGVWLVAVLADRWIGLAVGVMVLVAVVASSRTVAVPINRGTLGVAGFVSGVTGTATSIGGPPIALLYQSWPAERVRPTMAVYFLVGAALSLVGLSATGEVTREQSLLAAFSVPVLLLGDVLARRWRDRLAGPAFRSAVLAVCLVSAVALVLRSLLP